MNGTAAIFENTSADPRRTHASYAADTVDEFARMHCHDTSESFVVT
jgi:hypothetical protein